MTIKRSTERYRVVRQQRGTPTFRSSRAIRTRTDDEKLRVESRDDKLLGSRGINRISIFIRNSRMARAQKPKNNDNIDNFGLSHTHVKFSFHRRARVSNYLFFLAVRSTGFSIFPFLVPREYRLFAFFFFFFATSDIDVSSRFFVRFSN